VTKLMEKMHEELVRRNYAETTIHTYERVVEDFRRFLGKRLDHAVADDLRKYHADLLGARQMEPRTVVLHVAAVRFLYCKTLKRRDMKEDLPYPRNYRRKLPVILSQDEVALLINSARNLYHRALLMTVYSCGLRRIEACRLKVGDIDSKRNDDPRDPREGRRRSRCAAQSGATRYSPPVLAMDEAADLSLPRHRQRLAR
jgi:integrase/recombinase XerD